MKDYLQPAATFTLALAIASLPFTIPQGVRAYGETITIRGSVDVSTPGYVDIRCYEGCD